MGTAVKKWQHYLSSLMELQWGTAVKIVTILSIQINGAVMGSTIIKGV